MAPLTDNRTPLPENIAYTSYIPKFIIGLSIVYLISFLSRCIMRKYRHLRDKKQQQEIQRLKLAWKNSIKKRQLKDSLLFEQHEKTIECPPSTYNESFHSSSSSTLNSLTIPYNHSTITIPQSRSFSTSSSCSTASSRTIDISKQYQLSNKKEAAKKVLQDLQKKKIGGQKSQHWNINNSKRLSILWQWGVSKGYVEYEHAKDLNTLIDNLSKKRSYDAAPMSSTEIQITVDESQTQ